MICTQAGCRPGERCVLSLGLRTCVPSSMATCVVAGGGHYITFDGRRFRFPGSCVYLLSGLTSPAPQELADFRVLLGTGPDGLPGSLEVFVSGCHLRLDPKEPSRILVRKSNPAHTCTQGSHVMTSDPGSSPQDSQP